MNKRNALNFILVLLVIFGLGLLIHQYSGPDMARNYFLLIVLVNLVFTFFYRQDTVVDQNFVEKPLDFVSFSETHLHVEHEQVELAKIEKIVLELQEDKGILQLPYNNGGKIQLSFPAKYLYQLKVQFNQYLPNVEYIS